MPKNPCDWEPDQAGDFSGGWKSADAMPVGTENRSAFYKFNGNYSWQGVQSAAYVTEGKSPASIVRHVLIGARGESCPFNLRYFELAPGGQSATAKHPDEHVVVCIRGKGKAVVGNRPVLMGVLDTLYIAPDQSHQMVNEGSEPFGFFCVVNASAGRQQEVLEDELLWLQASVGA